MEAGEGIDRPSALERLGRGLVGPLARAARVTADFIVPPVCLACQRPLGSHDAFCADCWRQISFIRQPLCDRLGIPLPFDPGGIAISARDKSMIMLRAEADRALYQAKHQGRNRIVVAAG